MSTWHWERDQSGSRHWRSPPSSFLLPLVCWDQRIRGASSCGFPETALPLECPLRPGLCRDWSWVHPTSASFTLGRTDGNPASGPYPLAGHVSAHSFGDVSRAALYKVSLPGCPVGTPHPGAGGSERCPGLWTWARSVPTLG